VDYTALQKNPWKFVALTGLTPKEFGEVLPAFEQAFSEVYPADKTRTGKRRKRKAGGGRKSVLDSMAAKVLFVLIYTKTYPLQVVLGAMFHLSQAQVNEWLHRLLPVLQAALDTLGVLPERTGRAFARHERQHKEPRDLIIDGTERRRQRPKSPKKQAQHYSGRKKMHSDKNLIIVNTRSKRIGYLSPTVAGKRNDKAVAEQEQIAYPPHTLLRQDTGFQGYQPAGCQVHQAKKSRAGGH
jgi:DDE superfamily endonuclease/Helix-turn-helix of DDE superfamily endonuclease